MYGLALHSLYFLEIQASGWMAPRFSSLIKLLRFKALLDSGVINMSTNPLTLIDGYQESGISPIFVHFGVELLSSLLQGQVSSLLPDFLLVDSLHKAFLKSPIRRGKP